MDSLNLPSILTPDLGLLFWMTLAFLVVFFVLSKFGFPAIVNMVEKRKIYIDESLKKAHEASERLTNIKEEGEAMWRKFNQTDVAQQAWYYRSIVKLTERLSNTSVWLEYKTLTELVFGKGE
jgi:F-type H+-transporting ATPase subunit b